MQVNLFLFSLQATQSNTYGGAFLQKKVNSKKLLTIFAKKFHHRVFEPYLLTKETSP